MRSAPFKLQMILFGVSISPLPFLFLQHLPDLGIFFALFSAFPLFCVGFMHGLRPMMISILLGSFLVYGGGGFELLAFYLLLTALPSFLWTYIRLNFETMKYGYGFLEHFSTVFTFILFGGLVIVVVNFVVGSEIITHEIFKLGLKALIYPLFCVLWCDVFMINSFIASWLLKRQGFLPNQYYKEISLKKIETANADKSYKLIIFMGVTLEAGILYYYLKDIEFLYFLVFIYLFNSYETLSLSLFRNHSGRRLFVSSFWRILLFAPFYFIVMYAFLAVFFNIPLPLSLK